jgi:5'-3' exonuclease
VAAITAYKLVKEKGDIHSVLVDIDKEKIPEGVDFDEVRALFITPDVADPETIDLKWGEPDEAGILQFLCKEKGFNEERISGGIKKLAKARSGAPAVTCVFWLVGTCKAAVSARSWSPAWEFAASQRSLQVVILC